MAQSRSDRGRFCLREPRASHCRRGMWGWRMFWMSGGVMVWGMWVVDFRLWHFGRGCFHRGCMMGALIFKGE